MSEQERQWQILEQSFEQGIDAAVVIDCNNRVVRFNAAAEQLWGWSREAVLGHNVAMLVPEEYRERHDGFIQANRLTGVNKIVGTSREVPLVRQDGERRWGLMSISRIEVGDQMLYSAVVRDITEQRRIREEWRLLSLAVHETGSAVILFDASQRIQYLNCGCSRLLGWQEAEAVGADFVERLLRGSPHRVREAVALRRGLSLGVRRDVLLAGAGGRPLWFTLLVSPVVDAEGGLRHGVATLTEITQSKMYEVLQLKVMDALLRDRAIDQILDLLCREARRLAPELALAILTAEAPDGPLHLLAGCGLPASFVERLEMLQAQVLLGGKAPARGAVAHIAIASSDWPAALRAQAAELGLGWLEGRVLLLDDGRATLLASFHHGERGESFHARLEALCAHLARLALEREQAQASIRRLAFHDQLTGLANRTLFQVRAEALLESARRKGSGLAVLFIDLDRFKQVNDSFGHAVGDELLVGVAQRLRACVREADTLARISGDEFVVAFDAASVGQATEVVERLLEQLGAPMQVAGHLLTPCASVGISLFPSDGQDLQSLLLHADQAMYRAKARQRGGYCFFGDTTPLSAGVWCEVARSEEA
ncbi:diguanylate cyclase domain-containing protein [Pseudomonas citronellolis]|uniref:diguanylate cyclase domain-containing protein n=1 Tax=Pseudomonas citronellolis TaxID=53408 RepID=UPI0021C12904|nr:diguanylate cyclase [Pseudomonas citronellolis]UXJ50869.1 diguanylate cyclase [Pseudomonas citronellolis]